MHDLKKFPEFMKLLADRITSEDFLDAKYLDLSMQMNDPQKLKSMVTTMSIFDKSTG